MQKSTGAFGKTMPAVVVAKRKMKSLAGREQTEASPELY